MIAGLLLAVGCALAGGVAVLLKQRGAVAAPVVVPRHPVRSAIGLFRSKWWTVGWLDRDSPPQGAGGVLGSGVQGFPTPARVGWRGF